jgi:hypothetical protein
MIGQANAARAGGPASAGWHVWTETETRHVLRDESPGAGHTVRIAAARNEWESFQILVRSEVPIQGLNVRPGDLKGPAPGPAVRWQLPPFRGTAPCPAGICGPLSRKLSTVVETAWHFAEPTASASGRLTNAWDISRLDPAGYRYRLRGCLVTSTVLRRQGFVPATRYRSLVKEPDPVPLPKAVVRRDVPKEPFDRRRASSSTAAEAAWLPWRRTRMVSR